MARQPAYDVLCQAPSPNPRLARQGEVHGARIGSSAQPFAYTKRVLEDVNQVRGDSRHAVWCSKCRKATEYEVTAAARVA